MSRTVKHISLHRIAATELRVVANIEEGVLPLIQVEEAVIREYTRQARWPHHWVTLFILEDLQPLVRQLQRGASPSSLGAAGYGLSPESAAALHERPVVNVYDLADLTGCNVFVNRRAMVAQGYWEDLLTLRGLLAHEHAHPLAENEATRLSRQMRLQVEEDENSKSEIRNLKSKISPVLTSLSEKLCLFAPREIFTNEMAIRSGFAEALLHLNLCNVENAARSVVGREELTHQLQRETAQGDMTTAEADLLLLVGDLNGQLPLSLEVTPFYRAGCVAEYKRLDESLKIDVFPHLDPLVAQAAIALRDQYLTLRPDLTLPDLMEWGNGVLNILVKILAEKGLTLQFRLWMVEEREM
jgi:hypothetical protein